MKVGYLKALGPIALIAGIALQAPAGAPSTRVSYDRDVQIIFAENCFKCHGPDENSRVTDLRLDNFESATKKLDNGKFALVPGQPDKSEIIRRITAGHDDADHMPPVSSNKKLSADQINTIRQWIAQGGVYEKHWSYVPPKRPPVPPLTGAINPIDNFIGTRLNESGLDFSPEASRRTLARRLSIDLNGLPVAPDVLEKFVNDKSPDAYNRFVKNLISSPHYGETMAVDWLDLARYADTHGYHIDSERYMWRWREWVINSYNANMPYNQFITEQLAGDLLPNPTLDQLIATGFNRNHPITYEGGAIPEEYMVAYVADRVDTTSTVMMGLTMRCAQCHDHKYDPITQADYYKFFAYFNNIDEQGLDGSAGNAMPFIKAPDTSQKQTLEALNARVNELEGILRRRLTENASKAEAWNPATSGYGPINEGVVARYKLGVPSSTVAGIAPAPVVPEKIVADKPYVSGSLKFNAMDRVSLGQTGDFEADQPFSFSVWLNPEDGNGVPIAKMDAANNYRGWDLFLDGGRPLVHLINKWPDSALKVIGDQRIPNGQWSQVFVTYDGSRKVEGIHIYVNGEPITWKSERTMLTDTIRTAVPATLGGRTGENGYKGLIDSPAIYSRVIGSDEIRTNFTADRALALTSIPVTSRTEEAKSQLVQLWSTTFDPTYRRIQELRTSAANKRDKFDETIPTTMIMRERKDPRKTFILARGQYDKPTTEVKAEIPGFLQPNVLSTPQNRLDLTKWLTSASNPLVARVEVNRIWQHFFGVGLVKTSENFGTQGEYPTHPELLDWLATEFVSSGWNVNHMVNLIVTSRTYRQISEANPTRVERDPENKLLSHAPRTRLSAEALRDQALFASGLYVPIIGGPSVRPYQPAGLWEEMAIDPDGNNGFSAQKYVQDHGDKLYRRSMYTFWKRTVPPPSLQTLDAPEREFCIVRRTPTNTPLQALVLMNDPIYIESCRKLSERVLKTGHNPHDWIQSMAEIILARPFSPNEERLLTGLYTRRHDYYAAHPEEATALLKVGESPTDATLDQTLIASLTVVANTIFNMDEAIVKP